MQQGASDTKRTRRLAIGLTALGGAIAGAVIIATFLNSAFISPPVFFALFTLAGGLYGGFASTGIRLLLPRFDRVKITSYGAIVALGFGVGCIIGFARSEFIFWAAFSLPPLIGAISGYFARRWIADAGGFPPIIGKPGWALGTVIFSPVYFLVALVVLPFVLRNITTSGTSSIYIVPGAIAGAIGGWISGRITANNIETGLKYRAERDALRQKPQVMAAGIRADGDDAPAALGALAQQQVAAADVLDVLDESDDATLKQKAKSRGFDLLLPETPRQWRMVAASGALVFAAAAIFFSLFPTRVVQVMVTPTFPPLFPTPTPLFATPTPFPYPTDIPIDPLLNWDWNNPLIANGNLTPIPPSNGAITYGTPVYITGMDVRSVAGGMYTVDDRAGNTGYAFYYQLMMPTPTLYIDPSLPSPRFSVGEQVQVFNLSPDLQGYTDFWIRSFYYADNTWIYEVATRDGITFVRSEAQIAPTIARMTASPEPLPTYTPTQTERP